MKMRRSNVIASCIVLTVLSLLYLTKSRFNVPPKPKILSKAVYYQNDLNLQEVVKEAKAAETLHKTVQTNESLADIAAAREALEEWRLLMEESLHQQKDQLNKEWQKLKHDRNRLEDEKEEFAVAVKLGLYNKQQPSNAQQDEAFKEKQKRMNSILPADPSQFQGLNSSTVHDKFPGITLLPEYKLNKFVDPADEKMRSMYGFVKVISDMDDIQAEERFYELVSAVHVDCINVERMGNRGDGGWDICMSHPYTPRSPCLVYSFGINNDFTFDDAISNRYNCDVRSFDPSMTIGDHKHSNKVWFYQLGLGQSNTVNQQGWKLETLGSILGKSGHLKKTLDVLKIDIDYNEWTCLPTLYKEGVLKDVKQLVIEIHTPEVYLIGKPSTRDDFYNMYNTLLELESQGFRRFSVRYNAHGQYLSQRSGKHRTCCYELSYINIRYLKS